MSTIDTAPAPHSKVCDAARTEGWLAPCCLPARAVEGCPVWCELRHVDPEIESDDYHAVVIAGGVSVFVEGEAQPVVHLCADTEGDYSPADARALAAAIVEASDLVELLRAVALP